jgi:hypothetical protein
MIFLLALYLARTTPNKVAAIPEPNKRLLQLPRAVANQGTAALPLSLRIPPLITQKIVSLECCNLFASPFRFPSWEVPFAMGKSFHTHNRRNLLPKKFLSTPLTKSVAISSKFPKRNARKML